MKALDNLIRNEQKSSTKWISSIGTIIGIVIILVSIQLYQDFKLLIGNESSPLKTQNRIISKKISQLSFLKKEIKGFSIEEINELESQNNVKDLAQFKSCDYQVMINVGNQKNGIPGFFTLAYFESIPETFLENNYGFSEWDSTKKEIPVVIPKNYLDAYNYGMALSMNTPQISEEFLKKIRVIIQISGNSQKAEYLGKVTGLNDNLNSILVPEKFLDMTNRKFGSKEKQNPSRLIVKIKEIDNQLFLDFLNAKNYTLNNNSHKINLFQKLLGSIFSYQFLIALVIVLQGLFLLLFYSRIIIQRSSHELKKLFIIGYSVHDIAKSFEKNYLKLYVFIFTTALFTSWIIKFLIANGLSKELNLSISNQLSLTTYFIWVILTLLFILFNRFNIKLKLRTLLNQMHH